MRLLKWIPKEAAIILALFVAFFLVSLLLIPHEKSKVERIHYLSTLENGPYGVSRFDEIAKELGYSVELSTKNLDEKLLDESGVLFVLAPEIPYELSERMFIFNWVSEGGTLVYGSDIGPMLDRDIALEILGQRGDIPIETIPKVVFREKIQRTEKPQVFSASGNQIKMSIAKPERLNIVMRNVDAIQPPLFRYQESLHRIVYYNEQLYYEKLQDFKNLKSLLKKDNSKDAEQSGGDENKEDKNKNMVEWDVLAKDGDFPCIIEQKLGSGRIIAISNPLIFANGYIDAGDNAIFASNLLSLADKKKCIFDEYRHGVSTEENFNIAATGWGRSLLLILVVGLLAIYSRAVRFIPPRSHPLPERRSQIEYLRSMADVLRRAHAYPIVAKIILRESPLKNEKDPNYKDYVAAMMLAESKEMPSETAGLNTVRKFMEYWRQHKEKNYIIESIKIKGKKK